MPLRFIKVPRINSQDVLHLALSSTSLMRELSSMSFFPPATAAVSIVLLILQTLQGVQNNKEACLRLVRRCARILLDINEQMVGRWDSAPPTLIKNLERFQGTLNSIHEFMKILTDTTWAQRFMKKTSIENAIGDYSVQLEDAAQSFQIATLIDIHYAVTSASGRQKSKATLPPPPYSPGSQNSTSSTARRMDSLVVESPIEMVGGENRPPTPAASNITFMGGPEEEGSAEGHIISGEFRRYHQSEVRLKGKSNMKDGWWAGASAADVEGRPALVKRYDGQAKQAIKAWLHDVKLLQDVFHPSLPQMVGFSEEGAPTPFILLSHVQTRSPQALLLNTLNTEGLAGCTDLLLRFAQYEDVVNATLYIQRQRGLDDSKVQDFVDSASFRVDGSNTVIMGLPPPKDGWYTARNYGLTESLKMVVMNMLPKGGTIQYRRNDEIEDGDITRRISHLVTLTRGLFPADKAPVTLSPRVKALIGSHSGDDGEDYFESKKRPKLDLRQLRLSNIEAETHDHTWRENGGIPSHRFTVGDFGYIPEGSDFKDFVILGNVLKDGLQNLEVQSHTRGVQWSWKDFPVRRVGMEPFPLPGDVTCWTMAVPPNGEIDCQISHWTTVARVADAWRFLLLYGKDLAAEHNIKPEEVMLITTAGTDQDFKINDFATQPHFGMPAFNKPLMHQGFGNSSAFGQHRPGFGQNRPGPNSSQMHHTMLPHQNNLPTIMYLLTSLNPDFPPYWSHSPIAVPAGATRSDLKRGWTYRIGWCTGFINWIQLHPEDFVD
ncbi:hypothetical protein FPV67DRAFT_1698491 [Lyophyllum atratum]|nr:hypothetical protein FPV67DRAFT_1698491 [Lyophyllum atratum]